MRRLHLIKLDDDVERERRSSEEEGDKSLQRMEEKTVFAKKASASCLLCLG